MGPARLVSTVEKHTETLLQTGWVARIGMTNFWLPHMYCGIYMHTFIHTHAHTHTL